MGLLHFCSSIEDGSMKTVKGNQLKARQNREAFIIKCGLDPLSSTLHTLSYGGSDYCRYVTLGKEARGDGIIRGSTIDADAVVVTEPGHSILLPLADCVGAALYDPNKRILMMSHLGRHNLEQYGGTRSVEFLVEEFACNPKDIIVWLSPSAGSLNYPLYAFHNRSLQEVASEQLRLGGIKKSHIELSSTDSSSHPSYYSHSQFLKGKQAIDGRFAVVATMV